MEKSKLRRDLRNGILNFFFFFEFCRIYRTLNWTAYRFIIALDLGFPRFSAKTRRIFYLY